MAPTNSEAVGALSERSKVQRLLDTARSGDVPSFNGAVRMFLGDQGSVQDIQAIKDANGRGPLHFAASEGNIDICTQIVQQLKLPVDPRDNHGDTPLLHAARNGHESTALFLLNQGADALATSDELSATALHHAASTACLKLVDALLDKGLSIDAPSDAGTPLIWAAGNAKTEAVKLLLDRGANPNAASQDDVTPLFSAAAAGASDALKLLLENGASVSVTAGGATPLHVAADYGDTGMVDCLLEHGADPNAVDDDNVKPIFAAAGRGHTGVVARLVDVTEADPGVGEWTVDGIISYVEQSSAQEENIELKEAKEATKAAAAGNEVVSPQSAAMALEAKARGTEAFKKMDFEAALNAYTQAIDLDPTNAQLFSNRSLCWMRLGQAQHAVADAQTARELRPDWSKACYREGSALQLLQRYEEAAQAFYDGVKLDPDNLELAQAFKGAVEAGKKHHGVK